MCCRDGCVVAAAAGDWVQGRGISLARVELRFHTAAPAQDRAVLLFWDQHPLDPNHAVRGHGSSPGAASMPPQKKKNLSWMQEADGETASGTEWFFCIDGRILKYFVFFVR